MFKIGILTNSVVLFLLNVSPIEAQVSTSILLDACLSEEKDASTFCLAYIGGTIDGLRWASDNAAYASGVSDPQAMRELANKFLHACMPPTANGGQLNAVVIKYMQNHPENWHEPAFTLIHRALMETFPCR